MINKISTNIFNKKIGKETHFLSIGLHLSTNLSIDLPYIIPPYPHMAQKITRKLIKVDSYSTTETHEVTVGNKSNTFKSRNLRTPTDAPRSSPDTIPAIHPTQ